MGHVTVFRAQGDTLERLPIEADTLDETTLRTGHGVYTVFRTYAGLCVVRLERHLARMRRSAKLLGMPYPLSDGWLRSAARRAARMVGLELLRIRLTIPYAAPDSAIIALEPFTPPPAELYERGVRVGLVQGRREHPRAKDSRFIEARREIWARQPEGTYEVMLYNEEGFILEGTSSNFYAVLDGQLRTADGGLVLDGVARSILLEVAPAVLPVILKPVHLDDLPRISEAMLTSSSRGVMPIVCIGEAPVGEGKPGSVYARLRAAYDVRIEEEKEPL